MKKKLLLCLSACMLSSASVALGYVYGNSNFTMGSYPKFGAYLPYSPSGEEVRRYVDKAMEYAEGCDNDIQRIIEARKDAMDKANQALEKYNGKN